MEMSGNANGFTPSSPKKIRSDSKVFINITQPNFQTPHGTRQHKEIINSLRTNYFNEHFNSNSTASSFRENVISDHDDDNYSSNIDERSHLDYSDRAVPIKQSSSTVLESSFDTAIGSVGADITRDIYKLANPDINRTGSHRRSKVLEDVELHNEHVRRQSAAHGIQVPGGFRREFIVNKKRQDSQIFSSSKSISRENSQPRLQKLNNPGLPTSPIRTPRNGLHQQPSQLLKETNHSNYSSISQPNADLETGSDNSSDTVPFLTRNFIEFLYIYGHFAGESFDDDFITEEEELDGTGEVETLLPTNKRIRQRVIVSDKSKTSTKKTFFLLLKSFVGTGILFLPNAFSKGGLIFSVCALAFFGIYSFWCYYILIKSKVITQVSSFGDIGYKLYGTWMKIIILISLAISQIGFSGAYVIFTSKNLKAFIENVTNIENVPTISLFIFQGICFIPLSFVRNVSKLSLPSLVANVFILVGLMIVVYYSSVQFCINQNFQAAEGIIWTFNDNNWTIFIGTAIFAFEGIGLIIPIQDSMKHPQDFPLVLSLVIGTVTMFFIIVGTIGYLAYGKYIETVILLNLPQNSIFVNLIQLFYSMAIMLSTPLQLFPAIKIIETKLFPPIYRMNMNGESVAINSGKYNGKIKWYKNSVRSLIVLFVLLIAYYSFDNLDKFVAIIGSFACIPMVYMYPPMLHLKSYSEKANEGKTFKWGVYFDYLLIISGGISMIYTSYQSVK